MSDEREEREPVRVYDTSGPWGDAEQQADVTAGLPAVRAKWIRDRGDVEETSGRPVTPQDNGFLSENHALSRNGHNGSLQSEIFNLQSRKPLRAAAGHAVTQLYYAREGIVTPEMEFIALRENAGRAARQSKIGNLKSAIDRNSLSHQHRGESFGANIPREITPDFVRAEVARAPALLP